MILLKVNLKFFIKVEFDTTKYEYKEVISLGWYPPCNWYPRPPKQHTVSVENLSKPNVENSSRSDSVAEEFNPDDIPF